MNKGDIVEIAGKTGHERFARVVKTTRREVLVQFDKRDPEGTFISEQGKMAIYPKSDVIGGNS